MIIFYILLIISFTFAEDVASATAETEAVATESADLTGDNVVTDQYAAPDERDVVGQNEETGDDDYDNTIPVAGNVNFAGQARACGKITILGTTEPSHFDNSWRYPISVEGLLPDDNEEIIYLDYPGPIPPYYDHGLPPHFMPYMGPSHNIPIPYNAPMWSPIPSMTHPHYIEIIEPSISPSFMQPQLVEIIEPTMGAGLMEPHFIEIIDPYESQPMFDPFYTSMDLHLGTHHPNPYHPYDMDMVPIIIEYDVPDPMHGQMLDYTGCTECYDVRSPRKRETEYIMPVSGRVTITGRF